MFPLSRAARVHARRAAVSLVTVVVLAVLLAPRAADAGCNFIARAARDLRSLGGGLVDRPIAGPGEVVTLQSDLACNPTAAGFAPTENGVLRNAVELVVEPPSPLLPSVPTTVPIPSSAVVVSNCGLTRCETLQFTMPSAATLTDAASGLPLAGPTRIRVRSLVTNQQVVEIFDLREPTQACEAADFEPEPFFGRFTLLPAPNALVQGNQQIRGAVDGHGNLVIPLDFSGVLLSAPGEPEATFLTTMFDIGLIPALLKQIPSSAYLRSFNLFGRLIPPLVEIDATGEGFVGSTDVLRAVLQVTADGPEGPILTLDLLAPLATTGLARINDVDLSIQTASPLAGVQATLETAALTLDEADSAVSLNPPDGDLADRVLHLLPYATGQLENTGKAVAEVAASPATPALRSAGDLVGFLECEACQGASDQNGDGDAVDSIFRLFRAGVDLTAAPPFHRTAQGARHVDGSNLALSDGVAFFLTDEADEQPQLTERVSGRYGVGDAFTEGDAASRDASLSDDATRVAFRSDAANLESANAGDDGRSDVFLVDRLARTVQRASAPPGGGPADGDSSEPSLAGDGESVAFTSEARNLLGPGVLPGSGLVWERAVIPGGIAFGGENTISFASFVFDEGSEDVDGVDFSHCTAEVDGLQIALSQGDDGSDGLAGDFQAVLLTREGCFEATVAEGRYAVSPEGPLAPGSMISAEGPLASLSSAPALPPELTGLRIAFALTVVDTGPGGFAFEGTLALLADADGDGAARHVFVRDVAAPLAELVSVADGGQPGDGPSHSPSASGDGQRVAFASDAENLTGDDGNGVTDVFVRDRVADTTERVSVGPGVAGPSDQPSLSADGVHVAFRNGGEIFVRDLLAGVTQQVTSDAGPSSQPSLSGDGGVLAFASDSADLVPGDGNGTTDVFVWERSSGEIRRVSVPTGGGESDGPSSAPAVSRNGRFVTFASLATNLTETDGPGSDVFRFDLLTGVIQRLGVGALDGGLADAPSPDASGRSVAFDSAASDLVPGDGNGVRDVFVTGPDPSAPVSLNTASGDSDGHDVVLGCFDARDGLEGPCPGSAVAAREVATAAARAAILTPEADEGGSSAQPPGTDLDGDGSPDDLVARVYDASTGGLTNLGVAASQVAISESVVCLATDAGRLGAWRIGDPVPAAPLPVDVAAEEVSAFGDVCVFLRSEAREDGQAVGCAGAIGGGCDLNGDGDAGDRVPHVYDTLGGGLTNTGRAAADLIVGGDALVAFRSCELDQGLTDQNGDGDVDDCVMQVYDLEAAGLVPVDGCTADTPLVNTSLASVECTFPGCLFLVEPYKVLGDSVSFITREPDQAVSAVGCLASSPPGECDLDGDGLGTGRVVNVFHVCADKFQTYPVSSRADPPLSPFPFQVGGRPIIMVMLTEVEAGQDLNGDGILDDTVLRPTIVTDVDGDGVFDQSTSGNLTQDGCPVEANPDQVDADGDGRSDDCDPNDASVLPGSEALLCDKDRPPNGIDNSDIARIFEDVGSTAFESDWRDPDGDGLVTIRDTALCTNRCTNPDCAPIVVGGGGGLKRRCGLLGVEALLPLLAAAAWRRRAAARRR